MGNDRVERDQLFERLWIGDAAMEEWTAAVSGGSGTSITDRVIAIHTGYLFGNASAVRTIEGLVLVDSGSRETGGEAKVGHFRLLVSFFIVWVLFSGSVGATPPASAAMSSVPAPTPVRTPPAHLPANLCTLLPAAQIGRVLGQPFSGPIRKPAPPLYRNTAKGTECGYRSKQPSPAAGVPGELIFTVHVESSSSAARDVFKKLRAFQDKKGGGTTSVTGIGDAAYRMTQGYVLFVLKGKAHYSIRFVLARLQPFTTQDDQQQQNLATWVARQL